MINTERLNPFPGLRPFRSDEHHLFFGREEQTAALLQLLRTNRFLAVVGTSGSGKSSLVRAGMIAELHGGTMTQAGSKWEVMLLRPGGSPIANLARAFVDADLYDAKDPSTLPRLLATLNRSRFGLVEAMKQSEAFEPGTNLLVVVDQFEELFRFRQQGVDSEETAAAFVNLLLTSSAQAECPIYVTITMRSDYLGDCSEIPGLAEAVNEGEYLIPRLLRDQKRDAIEKPIGVGGAKISPLLVQRLLNDVGDDTDQLPVLQHALMRMWDGWSAGSEQNRPIDFCDFEATGGLASALSNHADEIYTSLPDERHRSACVKIFKALTEKGDDNRGIRRPTRLAKLQAIAASDKGTVTTVLDAFRSSGVTFLMPGTEVELGDKTVIDLSHESLMRGWQRLRGWVEDEAQSARIFRRLLDTARLWGDRRAGLFRDPDLQIALSWRVQEAPNPDWAEQYGGHFETASGFLEASNAEAQAELQAKEAARQRELDQARQLAEAQKLRLEHQQRSARKLRRMIAGLAVVAVIAGLACVAALVARNEASRLAEVAEREADKARQNEEKANQNAKRAEQSQQETANALAVVEAAEETGRKLLYTTDMRLAPFVWKDDRTTAEQLRVLLARHIPDSKSAGNNASTGAALKADLRGFEWHYYKHLLESSAAVFSGHGVSVADGAFTANGQLVSLDENGQVRRWDLGSQTEDAASRRDLPGGPSAQVRALSPNGRLAALAEWNKVYVFDTSTGKLTLELDSAYGRYRRLIFSRDNERLIIVDDKIRWCNAMNGNVIASFGRQFDRVENLALSVDGLTLAVVGSGSGGTQFSIFRLDATRGIVTPQAKDVNGGQGSLSASALSPDGQQVCVCTMYSGSFFVFNTAKGLSIARHNSAHASPITAVAFAGDGAKVATADAEGTIKIWADAQKLTSKSAALRTLKGHQGAIKTVSFSSDGKQLASGSADKTVRVWDLEDTGFAVRPLERSSNFGAGVARFSSDGFLIASAAAGSVRLWDAATGRLVRDLSTTEKNVIDSVAFSPTDNRLLAVGYGSTAASYISLWDVDTGTELARLKGGTDQLLPVAALAFSPDGRYLAAGFGPKFEFNEGSFPVPLKVWEVATRRLIRTLNGHTNYCVSLDFSKDGTLLASGSRDRTAILWSTATWKPLHTLHNPDPGTESSPVGRSAVEGVAFSPDGKTLALASREGNVHLWDVATAQFVKTLKGHSSEVNAVVFSPDGRTLASGSEDQTVRLWNVETRRELMQLDSGSVELGRVLTLAFSPEGKHLLAGGMNAGFWSTAPIVWNDSDRAAEKLRLMLNSNADFQSRIRMLSENLRLHEALAKLDSKDSCVQAALAATQANWHASRQAWPEAALAFDRLKATQPNEPEAWLRTPGLFRLATALLHENRPAVAAMLLQGGAKRRTQDGLPAILQVVGYGFGFVVKDGAVRISELLAGSPASRSTLLPGDVIVKVNGVDVTEETTAVNFQKTIAGNVGTKVRLTVRHPGRTQTEVVDLVKEKHRVDAATGELFFPLLTALEKRLADAPRNAGLLELRAELAGQETDVARQVADYTAAIEILAEQAAEAVSADLRRLYRRRGDLYLGMQKWTEAVDDYAHVITQDTTDALLLSNRARAHEALKNWDAAAADWSRAATESPEGAKLLAEFARRVVAVGQFGLAKGPFEKSQSLYKRLLEAAPDTERLAVELAQLLLDQQEHENATRWSVLKPTEMRSEGGATLALQSDGSILASGTNPDRDVYSLVAKTDLKQITALRLEALPDHSLPKNGPGRFPGNGNFHLNRLRVFSGGAPVLLTNIFVTYAEIQEFQDVIQGGFDKSRGWSINPRAGEKNTAVIAALLQQAADDDLKFEFYFSRAQWTGHNLGRFRLSVSADPAVLDHERQRFAAMNITDSWARLAAAYWLVGDQQALESVLKHHRAAAAGIGDLRAAVQDWERAIADYSKVVTDQTSDVALLSNLASAYQRAGRTSEAVPFLARVSAANPADTLSCTRVAALQVWFGQDKGFANTCARALQFAEGTSDAALAERTARVCCLLPMQDRTRQEAALVLARKSVQLGKNAADFAWFQMALGMAEYRSGHFAEANAALVDAMQRAQNMPHVDGISAFYRAMSLFRQGKENEARQLAIDAASRMKPLPKDEKNPPVTGNSVHDDLILWLAYREAKALIQFDVDPAPPKAENGKR